MIEFSHDSGNRISIQASLITIVQEESSDITYIVTAGNKGFGVLHSYDEVMDKIDPNRFKPEEIT